MVELSEWEWLDLNWFDEWLDWSDCMEPDVEGSEHSEAPLSSFTPFTCSIINETHAHYLSMYSIPPLVPDICWLACVSLAHLCREVPMLGGVLSMPM